MWDDKTCISEGHSDWKQFGGSSNSPRAEREEGMDSANMLLIELIEFYIQIRRKGQTRLKGHRYVEGSDLSIRKSEIWKTT